MSHIQIKSLTGAVLHEGEYADTRAAVVDAAQRKADLAMASLAGTSLAGAYLAGANLAGADLAGANLAGAYLAGANLAMASLAGTNLGGAYLGGACLAGTNLDRAYLATAYLIGADLAGAILHTGITATAAPARRATRADGYEFFLWPTSAGWRVAAGCRFFTMDEARRHWEQTRANTSLGDESLDILTMFELHIQRVGGGHD